ncbi:MAG: hypothetical protein ACI4U9_00320, partial [Clostridia bacterium]
MEKYQMRKLNIKRVIITILLVLMIIIELLALGLSRAENIKEISLVAVDYEGSLANYTGTINALDGGESGYYITLPEIIDMKQIEKYIITEKTTETVEENTTTSTQDKLPGDRVFLTEQELENAQIEVQVVYDTKVTEEIKLYNRIITENVEDNSVQLSIQGYMPLEATMELEEITEELINTFTEANADENYLLKNIYSIKLMNNNEEYIATEDFEITIANIDSTKTYKILQLNEEGIAEELTDSTISEDKLKFTITTLEPFAIYEDNILEANIPMLFAIGTASVATYANVWDGTVATGFELGEGTETSPYLISNGEELAYLRNQVNSGNTYEGIYFQLISDIDLNGNTWTPIGTYTNSFRGIFDGAGHTIANANITISSLATSVTSYGMFGSIGGGDTKTEIRNVEFNNINITITASGTTANNTTEKGYNIGIVTGTMFRNATVKNVAVKASSITDTNTVTIRNNSYQVLVGGIAGDARYSSTSTTDPGAGSRYSIDNCYVSATIDLDIALRRDNYSNAAQYYSGGIIGRIRSQAVWPTNCLFAGNINSNGFIGPIFGALRNNTSVDSTNNFATLWNGNDSGNLSMTSYYTNYAANGTTFNSNQTSGRLTLRRS